MYKLGVYDEKGNMETLRTAETKEEARKKYKILHDSYKCTIWIQEINFVKLKDL